MLSSIVMATQTLKIVAQGDQATIWIYGEIGSGADAISADEFRQRLDALGDVDTLTLRINSPGGSVAEVLAIHSILAKHPASVRVEVDGFALSAASLLAMAGRPIVMAENAMMMLHEPWTSHAGNAGELRKGAEALDAIREQMESIYAKRSGQSVRAVRKALADETWLNAEQAVAMGFADEISAAMDIAASFDLSRFNVPTELEETIMSKTTQTPAADDAGKAAMTAERARRDEIKAMFASHATIHGDLMAECLDDFECTSKDAGKKLLDALAAYSVPVGAGVQASEFVPARYAYGVTAETARPREFVAAAKDALLMRNGIKVENPSPAARDLKNMSIVAMAECCLSMAGAPAQGGDPRRIISAAFSHSTSDFPHLLSGVAQKSLMKGFEDEPASHTAWVNIVDVKDFKDIQRVQRSEAPSLLEVPEGAEYTEGSFGERRENYRMKTHGRLFGISLHALINDDLGAFTTLPQAFGASGRRLEADHVYKILTDNPDMSDGTPLFHADHGNLKTGGGGIDFASLSEARAVMRRQRGQNGAILNIVPRYLIVPASLEGEAEVLLASFSRPGQDNPGVVNSEFVRSLVLVVDPRLDEDDENAWYLAGSTSQVDTVELAYLEGQRGIYYEEREGWEVDGLAVKARLDFGTKAIDWKGLYKNDGGA